MVAPRSQGGPRVLSWDYSNADSFSDSMYSSLTFYGKTPSTPPAHPHYATLPRSRAAPESTSYISEAPPPYAAMEMLMEDYHQDQHHHDGDSGYNTGASTPEPHDCTSPHPQSQPGIPTVKARRKADYYWIMRDTAHQTIFEHGIGAGPTSPDIGFVCGMQPTTAAASKSKRRLNINNDVLKRDADPSAYILSNCENAARALCSHRKLHGCDCDFAHLDGRDRGTSNCWRYDRDGTLVPVHRGPERPCRRRWLTGFFVRQHMKFHDAYCGCGCFGLKTSGS